MKSYLTFYSIFVPLLFSVYLIIYVPFRINMNANVFNCDNCLLNFGGKLSLKFLLSFLPVDNLLRKQRMYCK